MPTGIYKRKPNRKSPPSFTLEHRKKIGEAQLGNKYNLGKKASQETRLKMSLSQKGKHRIGHKHTNETKLKIKLNNSRYWLGKKKEPKSLEQRKRQSELLKGEKSYLWKGGITLVNAQIRNSLEFRLWRETVYRRDDYTCQKCSQKGRRLHPHHIENFADNPTLRLEVNNGITLCELDHILFHKIYGKRNNTREQLQEFLLKP